MMMMMMMPRRRRRPPSDSRTWPRLGETRAIRLLATAKAGVAMMAW
jgi:hypothetical protein